MRLTLFRSTCRKSITLLHACVIIHKWAEEEMAGRNSFFDVADLAFFVSGGGADKKTVDFRPRK